MADVGDMDDRAFADAWNAGRFHATWHVDEAVKQRAKRLRAKGWALVKHKPGVRPSHAPRYPCGKLR